MLTDRRQFLIDGLRVCAAAPLLPRSGWAGGAGDQRALVVVQLTGANDGLNTVVPFRQDEYYRLRPTLGLKPSALHALDDDHGLHPELGELAELFAQGSVHVHHGVGLPRPDRSHFRAMEIWHTAEPELPLGETGWLGRLADQLAHADPGSLPALHVGDGSPPHALRARTRIAPTVRSPEGLRLASEAREVAAARSALVERPADPGSGELAFLRRAARTTYEAAVRMEAAVSSPGGSGGYPDELFAQRLRLIARLIGGGFGTRLFHLELGGFDTHARQAPLHAALLGRLSRALSAFQADLQATGVADRVATLVFSEFGRRAAENRSRGTDHGAGAPLLVIGGGVRAGLAGTPPDLGRLVDGDVPSTTDFRSIYTALERDWMGLAASTSLAAAPLF